MDSTQHWPSNATPVAGSLSGAPKSSAPGADAAALLLAPMLAKGGRKPTVRGMLKEVMDAKSGGGCGAQSAALLVLGTSPRLVVNAGIVSRANRL